MSVEGVNELWGMCREGTMLAEEDPPSRVSLGQVAGRRGDPDFSHVLSLYWDSVLSLAMAVVGSGLALSLSVGWGKHALDCS